METDFKIEWQRFGLAIEALTTDYTFQRAKLHLFRLITSLKKEKWMSETSFGPKCGVRRMANDALSNSQPPSYFFATDFFAYRAKSETKQ